MVDVGCMVTTRLGCICLEWLLLDAGCDLCIYNPDTRVVGI